MTSRPIDSIRAKVTRAKQHIEDFRTAWGDFVQSQPYAIDIKEDAQTGKRVYYLTRLDDVPLNVAAIAADVLGNLREAVDHIANQLETAGCGSPPKHRVYFPIADSAAEYPALRDRYIKCAGQAAIDAIDATEPYKDGKGHGLWVLNELKKTDKHHLLIAARAIPGGVDIAPTIRQAMPNAPDCAFREPVFIRETSAQPLNVGDELYGEPLDHEVDEKRQFRFEISLDVPGVIDREPALKSLQDLTNLVDGLVAGFEPLLP